MKYFNKYIYAGMTALLFFVSKQKCCPNKLQEISAEDEGTTEFLSLEHQ
jgi:hypothetical protein